MYSEYIENAIQLVQSFMVSYLFDGNEPHLVVGLLFYLELRSNLP